MNSALYDNMAKKITEKVNYLENILPDRVLLDSSIKRLNETQIMIETGHISNAEKVLKNVDMLLSKLIEMLYDVPEEEIYIIYNNFMTHRENRSFKKIWVITEPKYIFVNFGQRIAGNIEYVSDTDNVYRFRFVSESSDYIITYIKTENEKISYTCSCKDFNIRKVWEYTKYGISNKIEIPERHYVCKHIASGLKYMKFNVPTVLTNGERKALTLLLSVGHTSEKLLKSSGIRELGDIVLTKSYNIPIGPDPQKIIEEAELIVSIVDFIEYENRLLSKNEYLKKCKGIRLYDKLFNK